MTDRSTASRKTGSLGSLLTGKVSVGNRERDFRIITRLVAVIGFSLVMVGAPWTQDSQAGSPRRMAGEIVPRGISERHHGAARDGDLVRVVAEGAPFHSTNGLSFDAQDRLHIASVLGSTISIMDTSSGKVTGRLGPDQGVNGPDDLAFGSDGSLYWTELLTGGVKRRTPEGETVTVAVLVPGANSITFSDDGRLFVGQCFFGDKLFEVDPEGVGEPRLISDQLGPGCGLNAMDWGPDGFLYGPRWFHGEVARVDVDSGEIETVVRDIGVPAAVKFDSGGRLHVIDAQAGRVMRIDVDTGDTELVATLVPGLDNIAFDSRDRLFVSSYSDSFIAQLLKNGRTRVVSRGGMTAPGGVSVATDPDGETVNLADFFSLRALNGLTGHQRSVNRSIIGVSPLGFPLTVSADGPHLLLTSWPDNVVQVLDPVSGEILETHPDFAVPLNAIRFGGDLVVAELGAGRVVRASSVDPSERSALVEDLGVPVGLAATDHNVWVGDWAAGTVLQIVASGESLEEPRLVASGLSMPEGMAVDSSGDLLVVEAGAGRLSRVNPMTGEVRPVVEGLELGAQAPPNAPPTWIFNGVAVGPSGNIYVTGDVSNVLYRITPGDVLPGRNRAAQGQ